MHQVEQAATAPRRIHEAFLPWLASNAAGIALKDDRQSLTYGELPEAIDAVAAQLSKAGVRAGDRVLLVAENSVALALCILALSKLEAWSATVNARLSGREIDNFLSHCGARRVLYFDAGSPEAAEHGRRHQAEPLRWPVLGQMMLGPLNASAEVEAPSAVDDKQVAALVYTSGTTGAPKAVMLSHGNLLFVASRKLRGMSPADTVYGVLPLSHVYGLAALLIGALINGAALLLVARYDPAALARSLALDGVTVLHGVPSMYAKLLAWSSASGKPLSAPRLRVAQVGGAPLSLSLKAGFEKAFGMVLHNGYGMTETAPTVAQTRMEAPRADCSVGQAVPGVEVMLHGAESDPAGIGELWVRGPNVMQGYYRDEQLTAAVLTADGWLQTGDLARIESDGAIFIVGRCKELIIRSGFNVYPVEIEQLLNGYPGVVLSAVVGRSVADNEEVVAFVEMSQGVRLDLDALRRHLAANLSPYKQPCDIIVLDRLPMAATGKILKKELHQLAAIAKSGG